MNHSLLKSLGAVALAAVLMFGAAGIVRPSVAQAVTGSSNASLEETHIQLLLQIIELLKEQLAALKGAMGKDDTSVDDNSGDDSDGKTCSEDSSNDTGLSELEATIYTDDTVIKIELDGDKDVVVTSLTDRDDLISFIADKYDLTESEVDDMLTVEEEDRTSRATDKDWADGDDDDDDSCDESLNDGDDDDDDDNDDDDNGDDDDDDNDDNDDDNN